MQERKKIFSTRAIIVNAIMLGGVILLLYWRPQYAPYYIAVIAIVGVIYLIVSARHEQRHKHRTGGGRP